MNTFFCSLLLCILGLFTGSCSNDHAQDGGHLDVPTMLMPQGGGTGGGTGSPNPWCGHTISTPSCDCPSGNGEVYEVNIQCYRDAHQAFVNTCQSAYSAACVQYDQAQLYFNTDMAFAADTYANCMSSATTPEQKSDCLIAYHHQTDAIIAAHSGYVQGIFNTATAAVDGAGAALCATIASDCCKAIVQHAPELLVEPVRIELEREQALFELNMPQGSESYFNPWCGHAIETPTTCGCPSVEGAVYEMNVQCYRAAQETYVQSCETTYADACSALSTAHAVFTAMIAFLDNEHQACLGGAATIEEVQACHDSYSAKKQAFLQQFLTSSGQINNNVSASVGQAAAVMCSAVSACCHKVVQH